MRMQIPLTGRGRFELNEVEGEGYALSGFGTWRMSRGLVFARRGMRGLRSATDASNEPVTGITAASTACAQQPHVTQVGGHAESSFPGCS